MYTGVLLINIPAPIPLIVRATMNMAMHVLPAQRADETVMITAATAVAVRLPHLVEMGA